MACSAVHASTVAAVSDDSQVLYWTCLSGASSANISACAAPAASSMTQESQGSDSACDFGKPHGRDQSSHLLEPDSGYHDSEDMSENSLTEDVASEVDGSGDELEEDAAMELECCKPSGNLPEEALKLLAAAVKPYCNGKHGPEAIDEPHIETDWLPCGDDTLEREHQASIIIAACINPPVTHNGRSWPQYHRPILSSPADNLWLPPGDSWDWLAHGRATQDQPTPPSESSQTKETRNSILEVASSQTLTSTQEPTSRRPSHDDIKDWSFDSDDSSDDEEETETLHVATFRFLRTPPHSPELASCPTDETPWANWTFLESLRQSSEEARKVKCEELAQCDDAASTHEVSGSNATHVASVTSTTIVPVAPKDPKPPPLRPRHNRPFARYQSVPAQLPSNCPEAYDGALPRTLPMVSPPSRSLPGTHPPTSAALIPDVGTNLGRQPLPTVRLGRCTMVRRHSVAPGPARRLNNRHWAQQGVQTPYGQLPALTSPRYSSLQEVAGGV